VAAGAHAWETSELAWVPTGQVTAGRQLHPAFADAWPALRERIEASVSAPASPGLFAQFKQIALDAYDRIVGVVLEEIIVDGCIIKGRAAAGAPGAAQWTGGKQGMKRSSMTDGCGIPLDRVLAAASRHDSPLLAATLDKLGDLGPLPDEIRVHLDAGYDSQATRDELAARKMTARSPIRARRHLSRPASAGPSSGPTPGTTPSTGSSDAMSGGRT
jgi:Transposase DDE domain